MRKKDGKKRPFEINAVLPDGSRMWSFGEGTPEEIAKYHRERLKDNPGSISIARLKKRSQK